MRRALAGSLVAALLCAAPAVAADPLRGQQFGLDIIESDAAHTNTRGAGAVVAVIDTGVRASHQDLQGRLLPGYDFISNDDVPQDGNGHGTHVLGIVAANDGNGVGVSSVAPDAKVIPIRVLDDEGGGSTSGVARGIDFAIQKGADVINLSLGSDGTAVFGSDEEFSAAIDRALDRGIVVVAASGNNGTPACDQPSGRGRLLCVGAVDKRSQRSFFSNFVSNFGEGLGITAPGGSAMPGPNEDILSTYFEGDASYTEIAGTSQATPHVAGVAALLVSRGVRGQAAVNRLLETARDAGLAGPDPEYGAGIVNARAAVAGLRGTSGAGAPRGGSGSGSAARVAVTRTQRLRTALRRGIKVRCRAAGKGRCRASASRSRKRLAYGTKAVRGGRTYTFYAKPNKAGRRLMRRALRRRARTRVSLRITLPGSGPVRRKVTLRP